MTDSFDRWRRVLLVLMALFAALAAAWPLLGSFDPFGVYDRRMALSLFATDRLPPDADRAFDFALVPIGATTCAFFVLAWLVVRHAFPARQPWAYRAVAGSLATWFVIDTGLCVWRGAWFNVLIVNVPCAIALAVPLAALASSFRPGTPAVAATRVKPRI